MPDASPEEPVDELLGAEGVPALPPPPIGVAQRRDLASVLARAALAAAFSVRNPTERFATKPAPPPSERLYYRAEDGWEAPVWRYPPLPGASGEPVVLAHGLGAGARSFDLQAEGSLAQALRDAGFDVYLLEHRGDRHAVAPAGAGPFDFDDIVTQDVPAAVAAVRRASGFPRVLWLGHALGGQLLVGHAARGGAHDLAAAVLLCTAVRFHAPRSHTRLAAMAAHLLPSGWDIPSRAIQRALSPLADPSTWSGLGHEVDGPTGRAWMLHASEDVHSGLVRQVARWVASGSLCDRHDRLDYTAALHGLRLPTLAVAAGGDPVCPPDAARPAVEELAAGYGRFWELGASWGHLDPLLGRRAAAEVFPEVISWLDRYRRACW